jgi:type 1 glutamine amidotransferase
MSNRILIVSGGTWHDFEGFNRWAEPVLRADNYTVECTTDFNRLLKLDNKQTRGVIINTSLGGSTDNSGRKGVDFTQEQVSALRTWVNAGGGLLAFHSATVSSESNEQYQKLVGGRFLTHPEACVFTVYPMAQKHAITEGVEAFEIKDELYIQSVRDDIDIHMVTVHQGVGHPMAWTRSEGNGRVVHLAPGHFFEVWENPAFKRLFRQSVAWVCTCY